MAFITQPYSLVGKYEVIKFLEQTRRDLVCCPTFISNNMVKIYSGSNNTVQICSASNDTVQICSGSNNTVQICSGSNNTVQIYYGSNNMVQIVGCDNC